MPKQCLLLLMLWVFTGPLFAQAPQRGLVREMNSGKKPLSTVQVICMGAGPSTSDQNGAFELRFSAAKKPGDPLVFTEIRKAGYELVNDKQLDVLKIGSEAVLGVDIIMAPEGTVANAKAQYYQTSDKALSTRYQEEKKKLLETLQKSYISNETFQAQIKALRSQFEQQQQKLDALAEQFARINFDDVSALYQEALQLYRAGQINEVLQKLEGANLLGRLVEIKQEETRIRQGKLDNLQLLLMQVETYQITLQMEKARLLFKNILSIDSSEVAVLQAAAAFYIKQNQLQRGLSLYQRLLRLNDDPELKARTQIQLGNVYHSLQRWPEASAAIQEALKLFQGLEQKHPGAFQPEIAICYNHLGSIYWNQKDWKQAEPTLQKALTILHQLNSTRSDKYAPHLALALNNLGRFHFEHFQATQSYGAIFDARKAFTESLDLYQKLADEHPDAIVPADLRTFFDLKVTFGDNVKENYTIGNEYEQLLNKALAIHKKMARNNPRDFAPFVALTLINRSSLYRSQRQYTQARQDLDTALVISQQLRQQDPYIYSWYEAEVWHKLGSLQIQLQQYPSATQALQGALALYEALEAESPSSFTSKLVAVHLDWAEVLNKQTNQSAEALKQLQKASVYLQNQAQGNPAHFVEADWLKLGRQMGIAASRSSDPGLQQETQALLPAIEQQAGAFYAPKLAEAIKERDLEMAKSRCQKWLDTAPGSIQAQMMYAQVILYKEGWRKAQDLYKAFRGRQDKQGHSLPSLCLQHLAEWIKAGWTHADVEKARAYLEKME